MVNGELMHIQSRPATQEYFLPKNIQKHIASCKNISLEDMEINVLFGDFSRLRASISELLFQSSSPIAMLEALIRTEVSIDSKYLSMFPVAVSSPKMFQQLRLLDQVCKVAVVCHSEILSLLPKSADQHGTRGRHELFEVYSKRYDIVRSFRRFDFSYSCLLKMADRLFELRDQQSSHIQIAKSMLNKLDINPDDFTEYDSLLMDDITKRLLDYSYQHVNLKEANNWNTALLSLISEISSIQDQTSLTSKELLALCRSLSKTICEANEVMTQIIESQMYSASIIAKTFVKYGFEYEDLLQEAYFALAQSTATYKPEPGQSFSAYSLTIVRESLCQYAMQSSGFILPHDNFKTLDRTMQKDLESRFFHDKCCPSSTLTFNTLTPNCQAKEQGFPILNKLCSMFYDLDEDTIEDATELPFEIQYRDQFLSEVIHEALRELTYRQRLIVKLRFGIDAERTYTLEEVGLLLGTSRERVRQIELSAFEKMLNNDVRPILDKYHTFNSLLYTLDKYYDLQRY